jgi:hypothetical protein
VRYVPILLSLSDARALLIASGHSASEAEADICRALRERKIQPKHAIEQVTFRGSAVHPEVFRRMTLEDRNRFRLRVPADLAPKDLNWERSRASESWPLGEGYFARIARLQLPKSDFEREFLRLVEAEASEDARREDASSASGSGRDQPPASGREKRSTEPTPKGTPVQRRCRT